MTSCSEAVQPQRAVVDFQREVHAVLGLPIDAVGMADAVAAVRRAAQSNTPCMVSTPNLNFVVGAMKDSAFRDSVLHSDLNLADGMPLVWIARLLRLPIRERVAGADLFEQLARHAGPAINVFFFGGPEGAAQAACERVNAGARGLHCVGFDAPGFGAVEQMSGPERIARINASQAQFVVAALGAKKGQAWLQHNRSRLAAPVLCHLGAVVNFAAGRVRRAPPLLRRTGVEWLWRIVEEPALWRRYAGDGLAFARLLFTRVIPLALACRWSAASARELREATLSVETTGRTCRLTLRGAWTHANLQPLRAALSQAGAQATALELALGAATRLDSAAIGLLLLAPRAFPDGVRISDAAPGVARTFYFHGADFLLRRGGRDA